MSKILRKPLPLEAQNRQAPLASPAYEQPSARQSTTPLELHHDSAQITKKFEDVSIAEQPEFVTSPLEADAAELLEFPTIEEPSLTTSPVSASEDKKPSKLKHAFDEVRHFAGGLISHPHESTKHYSILRHSHGLVYYSGAYTNLAITIFADRELPPDRTLWLQRKGWSGKTGMRVGTLVGAKWSWINVTPSVIATPDQVKPQDERAWQRDIKKFHDKANGNLRRHKVRETNILRIPCEADDGYLRVVLCAGEKGKKFLCPSPVFRLASTSTSSSSIRGASLSTLPLEVGLKIASVVANNAAYNALEPVTAAAQTMISNIYQPGFFQQQAMTAAYDTTVQTRLDTVNGQFEQAREESFRTLEHDVPNAVANVRPVGDESGPVNPFPIRFHGKVIPGSGVHVAKFGLPTANIGGVPADTVLRYNGIFFGWVALTLSKKMQAELQIGNEWRQAIISFITSPDSTRSAVRQKVVRIYIIHDYQSVKFYDAKMSVMVMGFLRSETETPYGQEEDVKTEVVNMYKDIAIAGASLARPAWQAEAILEQVKSTASSRSISERYVDMRQSGQQQLDRVPVHRLGVRTNGQALRDRLIGNGGVCIPR